ncbi:E3 ubiquitin-protein ligase znrf2 isoform X2 [Heterodontus francisci]|uniref:E3 ubiquitin-protein ligase znrf2 isoform X2 n=1 Tax=Heterodontus francisci TaxID=7792 RepID=UPI00355B4BF9
MGAKQSSPATNGRTRAYSGSDLPSNTASSNGSNRSVAGSSGSGQGSGAGVATALASGRFHYVPPPPAGPRSMATSSRNQSLNIPNSGGTYSSQEESEGSTPEESTGERPGGHGAPRLLIGSLPAHLSPHLFGEDVLSKDTGECAICLEELQQGDTIARLPCLCIYHKGCIDSWFEVNRSCPEHPSD